MGTGSNGHKPSRWERILEQKPIPILDHLLEEIAKLLVQELESWPLLVEAVDPVSGAGVAELLNGPRPDDRAYVEAFRLTRWELEHDLAAFDDYVRHQRWVEHGLPPDAKPLVLFLSRWMVEQLSGLAEATDNRVKRKHLLQILDRTAALLAGRRA